jgi:hypothetical protein
MRMRRRRNQRLANALGALLLAAASAQAQTPPPYDGPLAPPGPPPRPFQPRTFKERFHDTFIGQPNEFIEPPLGFYVNEHFHTMRMKADPHRFTLYRTDFLAGTNAFSPLGASRFNLMASKLPSWPGPVVIEWCPDEPGVAESRKMAVVSILQRAGMPVVPERVVIGPLAQPGMLGTDAANQYNNLIYRNLSAPLSYPLTPTATTGGATSNGGSR